MARQESKINDLEFTEWVNEWYNERSKFPLVIHAFFKEPIKEGDIIKILIIPAKDLNTEYRYTIKKEKIARNYKPIFCLINEKLTQETAAQLNTALNVIEFAQKGLTTCDKIVYIAHLYFLFANNISTNKSILENFLSGKEKEFNLNKMEDKKKYEELADIAHQKLEKFLSFWNSHLANYADGFFQITDRRIFNISYNTIPPTCLGIKELKALKKEEKFKQLFENFDEFLPKEAIWVERYNVPLVKKIYYKIKMNEEGIEYELFDSDLRIEENVFQKEGKIWIIIFDGKKINLNDLKGLNYIAYLLAHPDKEFYVADLQKITEKYQTIEEYKEYSEMTQNELEQYNLSKIKVEEGYKKSDSRAKKEYKKKYKILEDELEDAKEFQDTEKIEEIYKKMNDLEKEIKSSFDSKGRPRIDDANEERIRKTIINDISYAINAIKKQNDSLAIYLKKFINKAAYCSYTPEKQILWKL